MGRLPYWVKRELPGELEVVFPDGKTGYIKTGPIDPWLERNLPK
jgi:hypothetical protein